jgi:preprotein translocase subunit SecG
MFGFLLVIMILDGLLLAAVVLMQAGQGGGLASLGGGATSQVLGGRQATNLLTRMTWWTGGIFMGLALVLSLFSSSRGGATGASEVQKRLRQGPPVQQTAPQTGIPGLTPPPPGAAPPGATAPLPVAPPPAPPTGKKP